MARFVKRYRRRSFLKALGAPAPLFVLADDEVLASLLAGRL